MVFIPKLEALASKQVLSQYVSVDDFKRETMLIVEDIFRFTGKYKLCSRSHTVFDLDGNLGKSNKRILNLFLMNQWKQILSGMEKINYKINMMIFTSVKVKLVHTSGFI